MTSLAGNVDLYPKYHSTFPLTFSFKITNRLNYAGIRARKVLKIIKTLDQNKTPGHDGISFRMLKIYGSSITKRLSLMFNNCVRQVVLPSI